MRIRHFFGRIRQKILRIILGRELFVRLMNPNQNNDTLVQLMQIDRKLNDISTRINDGLFPESRNYWLEIIRQIHISATICEINAKTFGKYQFAHKGQDIVIMGTGPTLNYYEPIENCVLLGTNGAVLFDKVKLDYLFVQDINAMKTMENEVLNYDCKKFFRFLGNSRTCFPIKYRNMPNSEEYVCFFFSYMANSYVEWDGNTCFIPLDICNSPIADFGSVIFTAIQFALWTYPQRIYLVGCDCTNGGHFYNEADSAKVNHLVQGWQKIKEFQQIHYPDVEIISINPVGLKGLFKDEYTESYLTEHPVR